MKPLCVNCIHYRSLSGNARIVCARNRERLDVNRMVGGGCGPAGAFWERAPLGYRNPPVTSRETHREARR